MADLAEVSPALPDAPARGVTLRNVLKWSSQGFWAVLDQALFALSNLVINVLLARWLAPEEYGAFVTAHTLFLLVSVAHSAMLGEPLLIFGSGKYHDGFPHYLRIIERYHWRLTLALSAGFVLVGGSLSLAGYQLLGHAALGLALTTPCILLSWLGRRACYVMGRPRLAACGGLVSLAFASAGIVTLAQWNALSVLSGQVLQSAAAMLAALLMLVPIRRTTASPLTADARASIWTDHWEYGRWSAATGFVGWFTGYVYYFALPLWGGLGASASLKALMNLVMPILQSDSALITLITPGFVRSRRESGRRFTQVVTWSAAGFATEAIVYGVLLLTFGQALAEWLYEGAYQFDFTVLLIASTVPLLAGFMQVLATALRAREQPRHVFWATAAGGLAGTTVGLVAAAHYGVAGAMAGAAYTSAVEIVVMLWLLRKRP